MASTNNNLNLQITTDPFLRNTLAPKSPTNQIQSPTNMQSKLSNIPSISPTKFPTATMSNTPTKHPTIIALETTPTDAIGLLQCVLNFVFKKVIIFSNRTI